MHLNAFHLSNILYFKIRYILLLAPLSPHGNQFNYFFSNVGLVLANKIPKTHGDISGCMSGSFSKSIGINDTISDEIIRTVNLLKSSFSKGADDISSVVTKKGLFHRNIH